MKRLLTKFNCYIGNHKWTSKDKQGIKIDFDEILSIKSSEGRAKAFRDYSAIFCIHCGKVIR